MSTNRTTDTASPTQPIGHEIAEQKTYEVPAIQQQHHGQAVHATSLILDGGAMDRIMEFATMMASGRSSIPDHLKNNASDCAAIVTQSMMWKMNPYAVAQKTHVVNGTIGYEGQLVNAAIVTSGVTKDRFNYEFFGDWTKVIGKFDIKQGKPDPEKPNKKPSEYRVPGWTLADENGLGLRIWATIKGEDAPRVLELLLSQASVRNSPLWATDPKQQLSYLAVKRWARLYAPDVILGVYTPEELDESPRMKDLNEAPVGRPTRAKPADIAAQRKQEQAGPSEQLLKDARAAADKGTDAFAVFWKKIQPADRGALRGEVSDLQERCVQADRKAKEKTIDPAETADFVQQMDKASGYVPE